MTLIKWQPVTNFANEFINMQREIDRMFDRYRGGAVDDNGELSWLPAVDIAENADEYIVEVELPGVDKKDVKITIHDDVLTVRGEKKQELERKGENYHRLERSFGSFQRSFTLTASVKNNEIQATYNDGILMITLPKAEEAKPKEIEVKVK